MRKLLCLAMLTGLILFVMNPLLAEEKERRPMTTDDPLNMVSISSVLMSPDG